MLALARTQAQALRQDQPESFGVCQELATVHGHLGILYHRSGRLDAARESFRQSRVHADWLVKHSPNTIQYREFLGTATVRDGLIPYELNSLAESEECFRHGVEQLTALRRVWPTRTSLRLARATGGEGLGGVLLTKGQLEEAAEATRKAAELRRRLQEDYPNHSPDWHGRASTSAFHASILARLGRYGEAEALYLAAVPFQEKVVEATGNSRRREELSVMTANLAWLRLRQPGSTERVREILPRLMRAQTDAPAGGTISAHARRTSRTYRLGEWDASADDSPPSG